MSMHWPRDIWRPKNTPAHLYVYRLAGNHLASSYGDVRFFGLQWLYRNCSPYSPDVPELHASVGNIQHELLLVENDRSVAVVRRGKSFWQGYSSGGKGNKRLFFVKLTNECPSSFVTLSLSWQHVLRRAKRMKTNLGLGVRTLHQYIANIASTPYR
jgi:hypothetical protein